MILYTKVVFEFFQHRFFENEYWAGDLYIHKKTERCPFSKERGFIVRSYLWLNIKFFILFLYSLVY